MTCDMYRQGSGSVSSVTGGCWVLGSMAHALSREGGRDLDNSKCSTCCFGFRTRLNQVTTVSGLCLVVQDCGWY